VDERNEGDGGSDIERTGTEAQQAGAQQPEVQQPLMAGQSAPGNVPAQQIGDGGSQPDANESVEPLPWEVPGAPVVMALFETVRLFVLDPAAGFTRLGASRGVARPMTYAVLVSALSSVVMLALIAIVLQMPFMLSALSAGGDQPPLPGGLRMTGLLGIAGVVGMLVLIVIMTPIMLLVSSGILHLTLMILSLATQGFETTLRLVCYAATGQVAQLVPFVGGYIAPPWIIVLQVIGITRTHRCSTGKATLAALLPMILCCGLVAGIYVLAIIMFLLVAVGGSSG